MAIHVPQAAAAALVWGRDWGWTARSNLRFR
jgi:hypothetical protein